MSSSARYVRNRGPIDVLLVTPPFSPSDTNPPLGPLVLEAAAKRHALNFKTVDLNIEFLRRFGGATNDRPSLFLGDQDKDRRIVDRARSAEERMNPLANAMPFALPSAGHALRGLHYTFEAIEAAIVVATRGDHPIAKFLCENFFSKFGAPAVLGLSIMGPSQVFWSLCVAELARVYWPSSAVACGGSHVTLLASAIESDSRYRTRIQQFFAGHAEREFADWCADVVACPEVLPAGGCVIRADESHGSSLMSGPFSMAFNMYDSRRLTFGIQTSVGCAYGKCAYCTYPAVERTLRESSIPDVVAALRETVDRHDARRFSFKDSYVTAARLRGFAAAILEAGLKIEWSATTMVRRGLSRSTLNLLAKSGCRTLEFGVETIHAAGQRQFRKKLRMRVVETLVDDCAAAGISVVLNLIYGLPGETIFDARRQLRWFDELVRKYGGSKVRGSHNLLEINRGSPFAAEPGRFGLKLGDVAPWAFSYQWDAPSWRPEFAAELVRYLEATDDASSPDAPRAA